MLALIKSKRWSSMKVNSTILGWLMYISIFLFAHVDAFSQHIISGTVVGSDTEETIPGVNVLVKGTTIGASTDAEGRYELSAPSSSDTLVFSFVGYQTQDVPIDGRSEIIVTLQQQTITGEDIVVVGYGTQRKEELTSSISSVNSEDFTEASPRDAAALVKGKVPGLVVNEPSGDPTENSEISLRGTTTLEAPSSPLILVDGVPGNLDTVAPQNIESVSVLKSGAAAAIYGSRASNGVILIETKQHVGTSTTIQYDGYMNYQTIYNKLDLLTAEEFREYGDQGFPQLNDEGGSTNWQDQVLRSPVSQTHNLRFSGGNYTTNYTASVNYQNRQGIILTSRSEDIRGQVKVRHSMLDDNLTANLSIISGVENNYNPFIGEDNNDNIWRQTIKRNPTLPIRDAQGEWYEVPLSDYANPLSLIREADGLDENKFTRLNGVLSWGPINNLNFKLSLSDQRQTRLSNYSESFDHPSTTIEGLNGYASRATSNNINQLLELTGTYEQSIEDHDFTLLGGYSYQYEEFNSHFLSNSNFPTDLFGSNSMESGLDLTEGEASMSSDKSSYKLIGFFSRLNYDWDNRFMLMGSVRYEGNSKFGSDHKWGLFPAVSAGWRITEEAFMEDIDFVNNLTIRAGFGVTGIAPSNSYQSLASYSYGDRMYYNGDWVQGLAPSRNANPNLKWERKEELNIGIDFSMFENRLNGSFDVYQRDTKDLLWNYSVPSPPYLYDTILANVGQMRNKGFEAMLEFEMIQSIDVGWTTSVNYSTNSNKLITLSNDLYESTNDYFDTGYTGDPIQLPTHRVKVDGPIGNFYGYESVDIDENGEWIVLSADDERTPIADITTEDRRILGNGIPNHNLAWNNTFRYKNLDLNVNLRGAFDFQILNTPRMFMENPTAVENTVLESAYDEVYGKYTLTYPLSYTSYYVEEGDYVKIDNVTLGYTLDVETLQFVSNARLYISGRNLYTFTGYKGLDPEVSASGMTPGIEPRNNYSTTRTFTVGVNLTF